MSLLSSASTRSMVRTLGLFALLGASAAYAQEPQPGEEIIRPVEDREKPPAIGDAGKVQLDYVDVSLYDLTKFIADLTRKNFVLGDPKELQGKKITIISHTKVSPSAAYEAYLSALEISGFTVVDAGGFQRIVKTGEAGQQPIFVGSGPDIPYSDRYVTQLLPLENVSVAEVSKVIQGMVGPNAKIIAYAPSNTLIITDTAHNIRKVYKVMKELDIAAPKSTLEITAIQFATAEEVKTIISEIYGTAEEASTAAPDPRAAARSRVRRPVQEQASPESVTAGTESKYISKVMADERTNSIIVLANAEGHEAVRALVAKIDIDVDPQNRAQIHVVRLENAKADEVEAVLSALSQGKSAATTTRPNARTAAAARGAAPVPEGDATTGAIAAFDSGMRIAADENTNSLVIIANQEDFKVIDAVIQDLDVQRRQVFVDAVIMELSSRDSFELGLAVHAPVPTGNDETVGFASGQFNSSSLGLTQDLLSGLALGVFGPSIEVPFSTGAGTDTISIPAFGVVLNALKTNSSVNIISNPTISTVDNEEAKIVVGRKVPFPTNSGISQFGQPITSFTREDVAVTLEVTPRVNSANLVTLTVRVEAQEIEQDSQGLNVATSGFITSKREVETVALVGDNQTIVLGGLVGMTSTDVETKTPILGDLPVIGALFRGRSQQSNKSNLLVFLTPHIIDGPEDVLEIHRVKEAQRSEFLRRFYGKSREQQMKEMRELLQYSLNYVDEPSVYRGPTVIEDGLGLGLGPSSISPESARALQGSLDERATTAPASPPPPAPEPAPASPAAPEEN